MPPAGMAASAIVVACGGSLRSFTFHIRARTGARSVSRYFNDRAAGSRCRGVSEARDGRTRTVAVRASARRRSVTIHSAGRVTAHLTNTFSFRARPRFTG